MRNLFATAWEIQAFCQSKNWQFCFIGGLAVWRWGETRFTKDVDLTILTGFKNEEKVVDTLMARYTSRVPNARELFLDQRVLRLECESGVPMDIALGGLPFEESAVNRATDHAFVKGQPLRLCSAEDLVVMKAFAGRGRDWVDVETVVARNGPSLDWKYIYTQLTPLAALKEEVQTVETLRKIEQASRG
jgi:hypothetical protein